MATETQETSVSESKSRSKGKQEETKPCLEKSKYKLLFRSTNAPKEDDSEKEKKSLEYVEFLKNLERKCGHFGFLDSSHYTRKYGESTEEQKTSDKKKSTASSTPRAIDVSAHRGTYDQDYQKIMKSIADGMWHAKQDEREYKRFEGDVIKSQREVRKVLKEYEKSVMKRRMETDVELNRSQERYMQLQQEYGHEKERLMHERTQEAFSMDHKAKDTGRKGHLNMLHLTRVYKAKMDELSLKDVEKNRIAREYETKLRLKEDEEMRLKGELADLANAMHMESIKEKRHETETSKNKKACRGEQLHSDRSAEVVLETELARGTVDEKMSDMQKRRLSADLSAKKDGLAVKTREGGRAMQTVKMKLSDVAIKQRQLNQIADEAATDRRTKEIQQRIDEANARRISQATAQQDDKRQSSVLQEEMFFERAQKRSTEAKRRSYEDGLKHFQRAVSRGESDEHSIYTRLKQSDYSRQQQEAAVRRLNAQLNHTRRENAHKLKKEAALAAQHEKELQGKLIRERAALDKKHAEREFCYVQLLKHRARLSDDKHVYQEFQKNHQRLHDIGQRTDSQQLATA